jgi:hypothetical protein
MVIDGRCCRGEKEEETAQKRKRQDQADREKVYLLVQVLMTMTEMMEMKRVWGRRGAGGVEDAKLPTRKETPATTQSNPRLA